MNTKKYTPDNKVRIVTAAALFDGHDAAINIMRRVIQGTGCEVIHLGHDKSAEEVVNTAIQEDANAIALTSYQGGHNEYFKYIYDLLRERIHLRLKSSVVAVVLFCRRRSKILWTTESTEFILRMMAVNLGFRE